MIDGMSIKVRDCHDQALYEIDSRGALVASDAGFYESIFTSIRCIG